MSKLWDSWGCHGDIEAARPLAAVALNGFSTKAYSRDFADDLGDFKPSGCISDPHAIEIDWLGSNQSACSRSSALFLTWAQLSSR